MSKKKKTNPLLNKKELNELKLAEKKLLEIKQMLEDAKIKFEKEKAQQECSPIIFKENNE